MGFAGILTDANLPVQGFIRGGEIFGRASPFVVSFWKKLTAATIFGPSSAARKLGPGFGRNDGR